MRGGGKAIPKILDMGRIHRETLENLEQLKKAAQEEGRDGEVAYWENFIQEVTANPPKKPTIEVTP